MSRIEKLIARFRTCPADFSWVELQRLLQHLGYTEWRGSGSRRKFAGKNLPTLFLHEPHPSRIVKVYAIRAIKAALENEGLI